MATFALPSDPAAKKKIMDNVQTISDCLTRIAAEKSLIKETVSSVSEEFDLPKKFVNRFAKTYHNQNYNAVLGEQQDFEDMVAALVPEAIE